jgi:phospholipase D1/2
VVVFLPLLPGFAGEIEDSSSAVMKIQLYWEYFTISRGDNSILEQLKKEINNPEDYIEFFSLR